MLSLLFNLIWVVLGGFVMAVLWCLAGLLAAITIVGLPWAQAAWRIAGFAYFPFGRRIVDRFEETGQEDPGTGPLGLVMNIVWIILGGWHIALSHVIIAALEAITSVGLPFAFKDLQLAWLALAPVGKTVQRIR